MYPTPQIRTLIVDDETLARERIRTLLSSQNRFKVVGEAESGIDALYQTERLKPDLVFLDIQMPEMSGLEVVEHLSDTAMPVIVFVTAYDQHALKAFELHALDYILKPIDPDRFSDTLSHVVRYQDGIARLQYASRIKAMLDDTDPGYTQQLVVRSRGRINLVSVQDVIYIEGARNYAVLYTSTHSHVLRTTLQRLNQRLDPNVFVRIHRSYIVNFTHINELRTREDQLFVCLPDGRTLRVGPTYRGRVESHIDRLQGSIPLNP